MRINSGGLMFFLTARRMNKFGIVTVNRFYTIKRK